MVKVIVKGRKRMKGRSLARKLAMKIGRRRC